ncbi:MAG TPA: hypothetical protein VGF39_03955 [Stellaceae bacterium]|jgi:hypothetical protein
MGWQNGTFRRLFSWTADANAGYDILADRMDSDTNDIVGGINNTLTRDGQNAPIGDLPMAGFKHLSVAQASSPTDYARFDQVVPATGNGTISGSLTVTGAAALNGGATVTGGLTADVLTVNGGISATSISATSIGVSGALTVTGAINANGGINATSLGASGPLTVTGAAALNGGATIAGLTVNGNSNLSGNLAVGGTLTAPFITCTDNRLICQGDNAPSVTMYNTTAPAASGFWVGPGGLNIGQMNGDGTPVTAWAYFDASGNFTLNHTLNLGGSVVQIGAAGTGPGGSGRMLYLP